jgi:hypothetical protein
MWADNVVSQHILGETPRFDVPGERRRLTY